ncbi:MAG: bile acid:sodium symporter family protein [Planctomycetales bacterium]|nr:bile acid:sodium symporter family protein [Planctomycetales bacterium]
MLQRYLIVWLVLTSGVAVAWPSLTGWLSLPPTWDPFASGKSLLDVLIVVTMSCIGLMLPLNEVNQVCRRGRLVLTGTALQYIAMPTLAFLCAKLLGLTGDLFVGMVLVGCVPGAMASNVLTLNAGGNTSYSVGLTTSATLVSPLAVPLAMGLLISSEHGADLQLLVSASWKLPWTVVIPVVSGHLVARRLPSYQGFFARTGSTVANLAIIFIIAIVVGLQRAPISHLSWRVLVALLAMNLLGYAAGYWGGRWLGMDEPMRRALTLEIGMQNAGLGAVLASNLLGDNHPDAAIPPALYTFGCMLTGTILSHIWSRQKIR